MPIVLKLRRGDTTASNAFTGAEGEVTIDTTKDTLVVHDGVNAGGNPLATEVNLNNGLALKANISSLATVATSGSYADLTNKPSLFSGSYTDLTNKPSLFSGSYTDLTNKPSIPSLTGYATESYVNTTISNVVGAAPAALDTLNELAAALNNDASFASTITTSLASKANTSSLSTVATSGSYTDLTNKPTIPTNTTQLTNGAGFITSSDITGKQDTLVSGTSIKTVNSTSLLGSGNIAVQATLVSGTNIKTINGTSLLGSGDITITSGGGAAASVTTTASNTNTNFKVPFLNTTSTATGDYAYLHDGSNNFTYNPSTNTLSNITLGWGTVLPSADVSLYGGVKGNVKTVDYNGGSQGYEVFVLGENLTIGQYPQRVAGLGHSINISNYVNNSVAIGNRVEIGSGTTTVVGHYARTSSNTTGATVIGAESVANVGAEYSTVLGWYSQASNQGAVALGYNTHASGNYSIALGSNAKTGGYNNTTVIHNASYDFTPSSSGFYATGITSGSASNVLYFDSNTSKITYGAAPSGGGGSTYLNDLSDVQFSSPPQNGDVLTYSNGQWTNLASSGGGGGGSGGTGGSTIGYSLTSISSVGAYDYQIDSTEASMFLTDRSNLNSTLDMITMNSGGTAYHIPALVAIDNTTYYNMYQYTVSPSGAGFTVTLMNPAYTMPASNVPLLTPNRFYFAHDIGFSSGGYSMSYSYSNGICTLERMGGFSGVASTMTAVKNAFNAITRIGGTNMRIGGNNQTTGAGTQMIVFNGVSNFMEQGGMLSFNYTTADEPSFGGPPSGVISMFPRLI